ncbi:MAG TPA: YidC/Oxa1 family membrane protein insertase [Candidatus Paceibacterota bacterium]
MYTTFVYNPLYNGLILLADWLPFLDAGLLIVLFTIVVKLVLFPISKKAVRTQAMMKQVEPELRSIKERFKDNKQQQAIETMKLYKEKQINPFSSIFLLLIQLPIIFALYKIFYSTGFSSVNADILYSFVAVPTNISNSFLGLIDVSQKSAVLAVLAAVSQYFQIKLSVPPAPPKVEGAKPSFQDDLARNMQVQMKYVFPIMILFISYHAAAALAIYWTTSNLFMIGQELYIRRQMRNEAEMKMRVVEAK